MIWRTQIIQFLPEVFRTFLLCLCRPSQGSCCPWVEGRHDVESNMQSLSFWPGKIMEIRRSQMSGSLFVFFQGPLWDREGGLALESVIHIRMGEPKKPLLLWVSVVKTEALQENCSYWLETMACTAYKQM